jgi:hypothetical protein
VPDARWLWLLLLLLLLQVLARHVNPEQMLEVVLCSYTYY